MSNTFPHFCRDGHIEIGHADSESELCPLCAVINQRDALGDRIAQLEAELTELRSKAVTEISRWQNSSIDAQERAEKLEAVLRELQRIGEEGMRPHEWMTFHDKVVQMACAALTSQAETGTES